MANVKDKRTNMQAQDEVVSALWDFAGNIQLRPEEGGTKCTLASGENIGTSVGLLHVRQAIKRILSAYGYQVVEIE